VRSPGRRACGYHLFGFEPGVLALAVAHFHFAGFAAALIAGLQSRLTPGRAADAAALTVPAGTVLVLLGYFTAEAVELAGALVLRRHVDRGVAERDGGDPRGGERAGIRGVRHGGPAPRRGMSVR